MKKSNLVALVSSICISISTANIAQASFVMTLDDLSTAGVDVIISDGLGVGGVTDSGLVTNSADGIAPDGLIFFNGGVGSFIVNVTTGVSEPVLGPGQMDLNSINVTGAPGSLRISLTNTGFGAAATSYATNYGGTTTGSVDFNFLQDSANNEFGGTSFFDPAAASGGAFSGSSTDGIGAGAPYSLTILADLTHAVGAGQVSSFDAHLVPVAVPVPASVWLLGSGLLGLVGIARRKAA